MSHGLTNKLQSAMSSARRLLLGYKESTSNEFGHLVSPGGPWAGASVTMPNDRTFPTRSFQEASKMAFQTCQEDDQWRAFAFCELLEKNATGQQYETVTNMISTLQYFPPRVLTVHRQEENVTKTVQENEPFVQSVAMWPFPFVYMLTVDRVTDIASTDAETRLTVATTQHHEEVGQHSVWVRRDENGELWLEVVSMSKFQDWIPFFGKWYGRFLQQKSHRDAIQHLTKATAAAKTTVEQSEQEP